MPVSPGFPAPSFPEFPQAGEPRRDAVSPSFPEFPHRFPHPVSPRPIRGGETGKPAEVPPTRTTHPCLLNLTRAKEAHR